MFAPSPENPPGTLLVPPPTVPSTAAPAILVPSGIATSRATLFQFRPGVGLLEEYSDNFNLTGTNRVENFRTGVTPSIDLGINTALTKGSLSYVLGIIHDSSSPSGDVEVFHRLNAQASWDASPRLRLTILDSFVRSDEPTQADRLSLRRERRLFTSNAFTARSEYRIDRIATTASYHLATFSDDGDDTIAHTIAATASATFAVTNTVTVGYEYLASDTEGRTAANPSEINGIGSEATSITGHRLSGTLQRRLNALLTGGLTASYAIRHETTAIGRTDDFDIWSVSLFSSYAVGRLSMNASLGVARLEGPNDNDFTPVSTSTIAYALPRGSITVSLDSGFAETFTEGQNRGVIQTVGLTGTFVYQLTPAITATTTGYYRRNDTTGARTVVRDREETTWGANVTLEIQLARWLRLTLDYVHSDSSSSGERPIVENRARLMLQASY